MRPPDDRWRLSSLIACSLLCAACSKVSSEDVKTHGIGPEFQVITSGKGTSRVEARLRVGDSLSNTYLDLSPDDELEATSGGETLDLQRGIDTKLAPLTYTATFDGDEDGKSFSVAFLRTKELSAPDSTASLPPPFTIESPAEGGQVVAGPGVTVKWEQGEFPVTVSASGCGRVGFTPFDIDPGSYQLTQDDLSQVGAGCTETVEVRRVSQGSIDPAYGEPGHFVGIQSRTVSFQVTP